MNWRASTIADRIHDDVLQRLGVAMLKAELCEHLYSAERVPDMAAPLGDLREMLEHVCVELRELMAELRSAPAK